MKPFGKSQPQISSLEKKEALDPTFGISGVYLHDGDPKGTVRVGNIEIGDRYTVSDLNELVDKVNEKETSHEMTESEISKYRGFIEIIRQYLEKRDMYIVKK